MIGKILKYMRTTSNLKQSELSKLTNIPQNTISQYETGRIQPTFEIIERISKNCGFKINFVSKNDNVNSENIDRKEI
ncbi:MAG: helix-turn-helix transcriptional regulator [Bacilli bacterium]|nr:helix-turn-helix transcriptional regulator [Bacilli bacterium]